MSSASETSLLMNGRHAIGIDITATEAVDQEFAYIAPGAHGREGPWKPRGPLGPHGDPMGPHSSPMGALGVHRLHRAPNLAFP